MQLQTQMGRIEMLPVGEVPKRWIDLSQYDVTVVSADDLKRLSADSARIQALREWVRGGTMLVVYGAGGEFERLAEIEKHLALTPLPPDPEESEAYRGWTLPDAKRHLKTLNFTADNLRKQGGFIPGIRPGPPTAQYLTAILNRITLPGSLFLAFIALLPNIIYACWAIGANPQQFPFGGTSVLIAVGVALETMKQIESQLMMRHYEGFLRV